MIRLGAVIDACSACVINKVLRCCQSPATVIIQLVCWLSYIRLPLVLLLIRLQPLVLLISFQFICIQKKEKEAHFTFNMWLILIKIFNLLLLLRNICLYCALKRQMWSIWHLPWVPKPLPVSRWEGRLTGVFNRQRGKVLQCISHPLPYMRETQLQTALSFCLMLAMAVTLAGVSPPLSPSLWY